jgi:D-beta-D-heptose 7-phosphate kinase / D-beta-D-heptose 1-phosphate adenosyltransferase
MYSDGGSVDAGRLPELARRWQGRRVAVLGDAVLDCWLVGSPERLCREAPVPVIGLDDRRYACGGAANTAANLAGLGARPILVTALGRDGEAEVLRERAAAAGVEVRSVTVPRRRTLVKSRVVADDQVAVRFDEGDAGPVPDGVTTELCACLDGLADEMDALMVCDYDAGVLGDSVRGWVVRNRDRLPLLVVDAHAPEPWAPAAPDLVTPSFKESGVEYEPDRATAVTRDGQALLRRLNTKTVAVTLDVDGAVVLTADDTPYRTYAQPAPARQASGAGDSYVAGFTLALLVGAPVPLAAEVAQVAATAAVRKRETAVCDLAALGAAADAAEQRVVGAQALARKVAEHRRRGRRIVFTNGCFDVLHRGHVGYLNQAKRLGDVLVVAVNSDDSVRRLKGPDRPVNPAADRVAVLAALSCVDHVAVFDEDSPTALLEVVRPDVYVKGGDYRPELIPEAPLVRRLGGEVRVLDYLYDRSTSRIIERIRTGAAA